MSGVDVSAVLADPNTFLRSTDLGQLADALAALRGEVDRLADLPAPSEDDDQRFDRCGSLFDGIHAQHQAVSVDRRRAEVRAAGGRVGGRTEPGTPYDPPSGALPAGRRLATSDGHRAIAEAARSGLLPDRAAERATELLDQGPAPARTLAARWAAAAGDPAYVEAFALRLVDDDARDVWTPEQAQAWRTAAGVQSELRAMSLTDSAGGYMVPLILDPAIMLTSVGVNSNIRARARVVTTTADSWSGVTSAGVTSEWLAEAAEASDDSPVLADPVIPVYKLASFVPFSFEVGQDALTFLSELQRIMLDSANAAAELTYMIGSGSGQPTGLVTGLVAASSPIVPSIGSNTFTAPDLYAMQNALGARWQANATWAASLAIINQAAQFETTAGALKFPEVNGNPPTLLRRPLDENSSLDSTYGSGENYVAVYGDLRAAYVIADRIGATFELIPHLFGANRRPTGQRGAYLYQRTGAGVVNAAAAKVLNIT